MLNPTDNKLLIPAAMILVAALIFGGAVVYLVGSNGHASGGSAYVPPSSAVGPATLPSGTPNPALNLPHVLAIHVVGGIVKTISASSLTVISTQDNTLQTFTPSKSTVIY